MTIAEVNEIIQKEYETFNQSKYTGDKLPADILERLKSAVFCLAPSVHQISSANIKKLLAKKVKDLTNYEVGHILNLISTVPFKELYSTLEEAVEKNQQIELLKVSYNIVVKGITEAVEEKRKSMLELVQPSNSRNRIFHN